MLALLVIVIRNDEGLNTVGAAMEENRMTSEKYLDSKTGNWRFIDYACNRKEGIKANSQNLTWTAKGMKGHHLKWRVPKRMKVEWGG